ncbi:MAG: tetratricopeptide repeat protein [Planctomycetales bacterium]
MLRPFLWLAFLSLAAAGGCSSGRQSDVEPVPSVVPPPPLTASPYRNTHPEVAYVGDAACTACHAEIADSYALHPMGQSMRLVNGTLDVSENDEPVQFSADGLTYSVLREGDRILHREQRFDRQGNLVHEKSEAVAFAVGAGSHGRSYLLHRGNTLWMSPITWYPQQERWDLSPNFEKQNHHFTRPILPDCVYCHAHRAHHRPGTLNTYDPPTFTGLTIGCERCHGPGALHVAQRQANTVGSEIPDDTIVNPRHLEPALRDGVCQQCHLAGTVRIVRRGRNRDDFRPGLDLREILAVFTRRDSSDDPAAVTSHEEQMRFSRCHLASPEGLACITCHDPHRRPAASKQGEFYRARCQTCHSPQACPEDAALRAKTNPADNCIACHMPAIPSEVQHAAMTDHRIPRWPGAATATSRAAMDDDPTWPLALFPDRAKTSPAPEEERDLGVALMQLESEHPELVLERHLREAARILVEAVERDPGDADAIEALAHAQFSLQRSTDALATIEAGLQHAPDHEALLSGGALIAAGNKQWEAAGRHVARLIALNPRQAQYQQLDAQIALARRDLRGAVAALERVLDLNPADRQARETIVSLYQQQLRSREAQHHANILQRSAPPQPIPRAPMKR